VIRRGGSRPQVTRDVDAESLPELLYADWGIHIVGFGPIGSLEPTATLEILLHLTR
jgi:hypothetical protein